MLFEWYLQILQNVWKQTCCIAVRYKTEVNAVDMCVTIYLLAFHIWTKGQRSFTSKHGYNCHIYFEKGIPYYLEYYLEYLNISSGATLLTLRFWAYCAAPQCFLNLSQQKLIRPSLSISNLARWFIHLRQRGQRKEKEDAVKLQTFIHTEYHRTVCSHIFFFSAENIRVCQKKTGDNNPKNPIKKKFFYRKNTILW